MPGRERGSGASSGWSHELAHALAGSGGSGHARHVQDREGKEGASLVARCGRQGTSTGARGRLEVVGGRGVNGRVPCQALQSATLAGIRGFPTSARVHLCLAAGGGMGKSWGVPWML